MRVKISKPHPQVLTMNTAGKSGCPVTEGNAAVMAWAAHTQQQHIPTSQSSIYPFSAELFSAVGAL